MSDQKVCVIGAGVIGLSVALYLAEERINSSSKRALQIVVVADQTIEQTTTHGCAGLWEPYKIEGTPEEIVNIWGKKTYDFFQLLHNDPDEGTAAGIRLLNAYHLCDKNETLHIPSWSKVVDGFRVLSTEELENLDGLVPSGSLFPNEKFVSGTTFKTYTVDQSYYLQYLTDKLIKLGVIFERRTVQNIDEFEGSDFDVIVNCCGIRGSQFAGDEVPCAPIRGQVVRVKAPLMQSIFFFRSSYIIPNVDTVVCGGTADKDEWNCDVSTEVTKKILGDISTLFPSIKDAPVEAVWVGLRPSRVPLRLDSEIKEANEGRQRKEINEINESEGSENNGNSVNNGRKSVLHAHCYGHGGSGVTLSWGCAEDLVLNHILPFLTVRA